MSWDRAWWKRELGGARMIEFRHLPAVVGEPRSHESVLAGRAFFELAEALGGRKSVLPLVATLTALHFNRLQVAELAELEQRHADELADEAIEAELAADRERGLAAECLERGDRE